MVLFLVCRRSRLVVRPEGADLHFLDVDGHLGEAVAGVHLDADGALFQGVVPALADLCAIEPEDQMIAASSTMILIYGVGALLGPVLASITMSAFGTLGFFLIQILAHTAVGLFALVYLMREPELRRADHTAFVSVPFRSSPRAAVLNPEAHEEDVSSMPVEKEDEKLL